MKNINIQKLHNIKKADEHTHTGIYEGERKDGKIHGYGTYTYTNGTKYVGYWKENTMHGEGTLTWASCEKYIGNWKDDEKHGYGIYTWPDGEYKNIY
ncbi:MAG: hypothetical protein KID00_03925 [Clostridium argentinense]|uniref:MORN repeat protein n=1 Tax=Clostridium faecium TaxID=2762223 RepID=A0ABR8YRL9_9CLOT|nr:hypothetical protein [uncultured Clostridium sp.]MBD8046524.1 hypothetical protein [Clostridium faecium]MBS5823003.1 hypothetical protein [Clostridium argentinense]